jgi:hypothetical protein
VGREIVFMVRTTDSGIKEIQYYLSQLSSKALLAGLKFAYKRQVAEEKGSLLLGRKSKVKKETKLLTREQAKWRLSNWKSMIRTYREKGYSYATICRIKKQIKKTAYMKNFHPPNVTN